MLEGFKNNQMLLTGQRNILEHCDDVRTMKKLGKGVCFTAYFD
jgi:hypothetical protein